MSCVFTIYDHFGQPLASFNSAVHSPEDSRDPGIGARFICQLDELSLIPGRYRINVAISSDGVLQDHIEGASFFEVEQGLIKGRPIIKGSGYGRVCMHHRWTMPQF
jgi:homopolymeric O-antigen transport system ATP-binding protein